MEVVRDSGHRDVADSRTGPPPEGAGPVVGEAESVNWTGLLTNPTPTPTKPPTAKNSVDFRYLFPYRFYGAPKNGVSILPNAE